MAVGFLLVILTRNYHNVELAWYVGACTLNKRYVPYDPYIHVYQPYVPNGIRQRLYNVYV